MSPEFLFHLRHHWPLAVVVAGLFVYISFVLFSGVFYTNQGSLLRSTDPKGYWRWVTRFILLFLASLVVLLGSYALSKP